MEFLHSWWWTLLVAPVVGVVGRIAWKRYKEYTKTTPTKIDDEVVELVDEAVATYQAGKEVKSEPTPSVQQQPVVSPELTEEERQAITSGP